MIILLLKFKVIIITISLSGLVKFTDLAAQAINNVGSFLLCKGFSPDCLVDLLTCVGIRQAVSQMYAEE